MVLKKLDQWNDEMEEKEKIRLAYCLMESYRLNILSEVFNGEMVFLVNFEYAKDASPIYDLVSFSISVLSFAHAQ